VEAAKGLLFDLCYDGWDPAFRTEFARFIQDYENPPYAADREDVTLRKMLLTPRQGPNSNHYGAVVGGCGLAVLAVQGDPGTDATVPEQYDRAVQVGIAKGLNGGFGDGGYFAEGMGPGGIFTDTAFSIGRCWP
jgi:hypothetical protein